MIYTVKLRIISKERFYELNTDSDYQNLINAKNIIFKVEKYRWDKFWNMSSNLIINMSWFYKEELIFINKYKVLLKIL